MTDSPPSSSLDELAPTRRRANPNLDQFDVVDTDLPCMGCGYNLRGLHAAGACPECGLAVGRSTRGDRLMYADARWVRRLAGGMMWAGGAIAVMGFEILFLPMAAEVGGPLGEALSLALLALPVLIGGWACWQFTSPEPRRIGHEGTLSHRRVARACGVMLAAIFVWWLGMGIPPLIDEENVVGAAVVVATIGAHTAGRYAADIARRLGDLSLASQTRSCAAGATIVGGYISFIFAWSFIADLTGWSYPGEVSDFVSAMLLIGGCMSSCTAIFCAIWALVLIGTFTSGLKAAAEMAANWPERRGEERID